MACALTCPRCAAVLERVETSRCPACDARYPHLDGVPCVLHDAAAAVDRFARAYDGFAGDSRAQLDAIAAALEDPTALTSTRARLAAFADGVRETAASIATLRGRFGLDRRRGDAPEPVPSVAGHAALLDDYEYLFRDWGWGAHAEAEHARARDLVLTAIGDRAASRVLVLGAGAGRLAYDLHRALGASSTLAVDINPLLVAVARRMFAGDALTLAEFAPNHLASPHAVVRRSLHAPAAAPPGLELLLADGTRPPVAPGSFDVVVTPWFVDRLDRDLRWVLPGIHTTLAPDGRWVCFGPLLHARGKALASCHTADEVIELAPTCGFAVTSEHREVIPYMDAPEGSGRREPVMVLAADRVPGERWDLPTWLRGVEIPVPRTAATTRACGPVAAAIGALVDGRRSALATATLLASRGVPRRVALDATIEGLMALQAQR